jgi:hypothetical protein
VKGFSKCHDQVISTPSFICESWPRLVILAEICAVFRNYSRHMPEQYLKLGHEAMIASASVLFNSLLIHLPVVNTLLFLKIEKIIK